MVIYEWKDNEMLGKVTSMVDDTLPVSNCSHTLAAIAQCILCDVHQQKTYVCTTDAVRGGFCDSSDLGKFIIDLPPGESLNDTSFWTARIGFRSSNGSSSIPSELTRPDFCLTLTLKICCGVHKVILLVFFGIRIL